jgi:hypothetical protein
MQRGSRLAAVRDGDLDEQIFRRGFRVLDEHVEVTTAAEHAGVQELVFEIRARLLRVRVDEVRVGIGGLRILVQIFHVRVRRRRVEVEVVLLHVLAVIAFAVRETEETLLEDRILPVPEREPEAQELPVVGDPRKAVFAPTVRARPGLIVAEVGPRIARGAVVLADGAPLTLAQVRSPLAPGHACLPGLLEPSVFRRAVVGRHVRPRFSFGPRRRSGQCGQVQLASSGRSAPCSCA